MTSEDADRAASSDVGSTPAEAASHADVDEAFVRRLLELELIAEGPAGGLTEGDVRRIRVFQSLERAGLPLDAIGEANRMGGIELGFLDDPAYRLFAGLTDATFRSTSVETGIALELLYAIREAMGSVQPGPDDRMREMELQVVPAIQHQLRHNVRPKVIDRMLRSYGDNLRRMAEIEADWWMSDVMQPIFISGGTLADIGPRTAEFSNTFSQLSDEMVLALLHGNQANAWMKNFFQGFEGALQRAGLHRATDRVPAICFLDLSGYTRLTEERGDEHAADLAGRLARLVQRTSSQHGGKPIKWLGDGVMFHFGDPGPGVLAALEMVEGAKEADLPPAHVGLHAGPVLFQEGDYFGRTVNVAARIADYARQGEVLVSEDVVAASSVPGVRFEPIGPVELKGLTEAVSLHIARRST